MRWDICATGRAAKRSIGVRSLTARSRLGLLSCAIIDIKGVLIDFASAIELLR